MLKDLFFKNKIVFILSCICIAFVLALVIVMGAIYIGDGGSQNETEAHLSEMAEPEFDGVSLENRVTVNRASIDLPTVKAEPAAQGIVGPSDAKEVMNKIGDINGVWIASVFNINYPSRADLDKAELQSELDKIVETTKKAGLNTIFFQVRPQSDALYDSKIYPVSKYMSTKGELELDALAYLIEAAHKENIAVHAWINPVRVTSKSGVETDDLAEGNPAREHPEYVVRYGDGKLYYDLGIPEVRELICRGVEEIVRNYAVDGIVFDDYFYPYPVRYTDEKTGESRAYEFEDRHTYKQYNEAGLDIEDWRRNNVNMLVESVYKTVKQIDLSCIFGVSPFGIWENGYGDESGSLTTGTESYSELYCDTLAWIDGGYVDYIAPQLYWTNETASAPYDHLCDWWQERVSGKKVRLLISHGAYRYENDWIDPFGIMTSQIEYASQKHHYKGSLFYGYGAIAKNESGLLDELASIYADKE